jgi:hypothetical protein
MCKEPLCTIPVVISMVMMVFGIGFTTTASVLLFEPEISQATAPFSTLLIALFIFGIFLIIINVFGMVVTWGRGSNQDDDCCDKCENLAAGPGYIIYAILAALLVVFTASMCGILSWTIFKNNPNDPACPGIDFNDKTVCNGFTCTNEGSSVDMLSCPIDVAVMVTCAPLSSSNTGAWLGIQDLFTQCGYYCGGGNCTVANGNSTDVDSPDYNPYKFQLTGTYCRNNLESDSSSPSKLASWSIFEKDNFLPDTYDGKYGVEPNSIIRPTRDSIHAFFGTFGIPAAIFLYFALLLQIVSIVCIACLGCKSSEKYKR